MSPKFVYFSMALLLAGSPFQINASDMKEKEIPAGWELSATLALFRNLPLMESGQFPKTSGDVYLARSEEFQDGAAQTFINTYNFCRKADNGKFMIVTVVEKHEMGQTGDGGFYHKVFDISRSLSSGDALPPKSDKIAVVSELLEYIFDYREPLKNSQAGELAKELNYGTGGRVRTPDYGHPRVSFTEDKKGNVEKVRIHGLTTLLGANQAAATKGSDENQVLEMSVDQSGKAVVSFSAVRN